MQTHEWVHEETTVEEAAFLAVQCAFQARSVWKNPETRYDDLVHPIHGLATESVYELSLSSIWGQCWRRNWTQSQILNPSLSVG